MASQILQNVAACATVSGLLTLTLLLFSLINFTQQGPQIAAKIRRSYLLFTVAAIIRLCAYSFILTVWLAFFGGSLYLAIIEIGAIQYSFIVHLLFCGASVTALAALQFCKHLLWIPSSLMMSSHYRMTRFNFIHGLLSVSILRWSELLGLGIYLGVMASYLFSIAESGTQPLALVCAYIALPLLPYFYVLVSGNTPGKKSRRVATDDDRLNVLMIGSDTLRADQPGKVVHGESVSPFLDALALRGIHFKQCYTSIARTAPSLVSLFTGTWPQSNGITTNYNTLANSRLPAASLGAILRSTGYNTAAISDWAGSDLGKFELGFETADLPGDQWNLKYLIRQGPKDLRLFLSLFAHNKLGERFIPEIFYLAGKPMTSILADKTIRQLTKFAGRNEPFFLNVFMSSNHPPFGSEYPYYLNFSNPEYCGESKFGMRKLTDPAEIIKSQREPKESFDLDQILELYHGCTRNFDDQVRRIYHHLQDLGLDQNTLLVIYSDHGMEFFEHDTWGQGNSIRGDASNKIPMIVVHPGKRSTGVYGKPVRALDLMPTILDFCEIDIPDHVQGQSLAPAFEGIELPDLPVFTQTGIWLTTPPGQEENHVRYPDLIELLEIPDIKTGTLAIKEQYKSIIEQARDCLYMIGAWKLYCIPLTSGPRYELYNTLEDPLCQRDVANENPELLARLIEESSSFSKGSAQQ